MRGVRLVRILAKAAGDGMRDLFTRSIQNGHGSIQILFFEEGGDKTETNDRDKKGGETNPRQGIKKVERQNKYKTQ